MKTRKPNNSVRTRRGEAVAMADAAEALDGVLRKIDGKVLREIGAIAVLIRNLRKELSALGPGKMGRDSLPAAGRELEAVVSATEAASNRILQCAEEVMAADVRDPVRYRALVDARMTSIFEACEFQDLTGQRIGRIIATLKQIEARVAQFAGEPSMSGRRGRSSSHKRGNSQVAIDRMFRRRKRA